MKVLGVIVTEMYKLLPPVYMSLVKQISSLLYSPWSDYRLLHVHGHDFCSQSKPNSVVSQNSIQFVLFLTLFGDVQTVMVNNSICMDKFEGDKEICLLPNLLLPPTTRYASRREAKSYHFCG